MELGQASALIFVSPSPLGVMWELVSRLIYQRGGGCWERDWGEPSSCCGEAETEEHNLSY